MAQILTTEIVTRGKSTYAVFTVPSSNGKSEYRVDVTNGRCSCKGWTLKKADPITGKRTPCKHLRQFGYSENTLSI
jgi:hypothetical protein